MCSHCKINSRIIPASKRKSKNNCYKKKKRSVKILTRFALFKVEILSKGRPIAKRTSNKIKTGLKFQVINIHKYLLVTGISFSPRHDTTIHPDEIQDAISCERSMKRKREKILSEEADKTADSFDRVITRSPGASFDAPCHQSKKYKISRKEREMKMLQLDSIHYPMVSINGPYTQVPGTSFAVFLPQQKKKQRISKRKLELKRLQIDSKIFKSLLDTLRLSRLRSSTAAINGTSLSLLAHNKVGPYQMKQEQQPDGSPLLTKKKGFDQAQRLSSFCSPKVSRAMKSSAVLQSLLALAVLITMLLKAFVPMVTIPVSVTQIAQ